MNMPDVDVARKAFDRLAKLGLPPTPENYDAQYRDLRSDTQEIAASAAPADEPAERFAMLRTLVQVMTSANADLHADVSRFAAESTALVERAEASAGKQAVNDLFSAMIASSSWLLVEVDRMRGELERTRAELSLVSSELQEVHHLAICDALTGLPNRRGIDEALTREISRARRHRLPLCVGMLDLDHFKQLNDRHGHLVGDAALVHFAETLKGTLRDVDYIARYGGEEFLVIMPDTALAGAELGLNRLLRHVADRPLIAGDDRIPVPFSAGVAQWRQGESAAQLIERADAALYAAKRAGRARVAVSAADDEYIAMTAADPS